MSDRSRSDLENARIVLKASGTCPHPAQAGQPGRARDGSTPVQLPYRLETVRGHSPTRPRVSHPTVADDAPLSEHQTPEVVPVQNESVVRERLDRAQVGEAHGEPHANGMFDASRSRTLTPRERRRAVIAKAVRHMELAGIRERGARQEWAESRKHAGWDPLLVEHAIGGGALEFVRAKVRDEAKTDDRALARAMHALSIIDVGRRLEVVLPRSLERREAAAG
jgi:hypothetical protein